MHGPLLPLDTFLFLFPPDFLPRRLFSRVGDVFAASPAGENEACRSFRMAIATPTGMVHGAGITVWGMSCY